MSADLYQPVFLLSMLAIGLAMGSTRLSSPDSHLQEAGSHSLFAIILSLLLAFWIGLRPVSFVFGDTTNYALEYSLKKVYDVRMNWSDEWIWQWLMVGCKAAGFSVQVFFTIVAFGYVMSACWAVKRLLPKDPMLGMVFLLTSLMYFPFATNGLRNGLACHIVLLAFSFLLDSKWVPGAAFSLLAFGIHRSTMLPIAAVLVAIFLMRNVRYAIAFWILSIFISLVAGGFFSNIFTSLGFDDRMTQYVQTIDESYGYTNIGFRWDFLLYSSFPVILAWYVVAKKGVTDNWFNVLATTYCICNAFWIMIIRSAFSNRFAYLSWFMYPIVVAYPLIYLPIWEDQDRMTGWILLGYCAFTAFMWFVVW